MLLNKFDALYFEALLGILKEMPTFPLSFQNCLNIASVKTAKINMDAA